MTEEVVDLLKKALALPVEARAALAGSLLDTLDETVDEGVEASWDERDSVAHRAVGCGHSEDYALDRSAQTDHCKAVPRCLSQ
jgi:hypothetical protein